MNYLKNVCKENFWNFLSLITLLKYLLDASGINNKE